MHATRNRLEYSMVMAIASVVFGTGQFVHHKAGLGNSFLYSWQAGFRHSVREDCP